MTNTTISSEKADLLQEEFFGGDLREEAVLGKLGSLLRGYNRFIDIGANVGQYAYFANKFLWNAEIICVEANSDLFAFLKDTISRANSETPHNNKFEILHNIVSDFKGKTIFYVNSEATASSIFRERNETKLPSHISVNSITLDELYAPCQRTFIKIDIEGAEYRTLLASRRFLKSSTTTFLIELHPWGDPERKRYPLHLGAVMCFNRYTMKKIVPHYFFGSHYIFTKSNLFRGVLSYAYYFPVLFAEFVVYRFFPNNAENITQFLRALFKRPKNRSSRC